MGSDKVVAKVFGEEATLTPSDIVGKTFSRAVLGGYKRVEVDAFLRRIANYLEPLLEQLKALRAEREETQAQLQEYKEIEGALREALMTSQKFGGEIIEQAKREAHILIEEARLERARAQLEAAKVPMAFSRDVQLLEEQRRRLRAEILAVLESHRSLLDRLIPPNEAAPPGFFDPGARRAPQTEPGETPPEPGEFPAEEG